MSTRLNVISAIEVSNKAAEARRKKISMPSSPAAHLLAPQLASNEKSIQLDGK
jgi:hypothetical protein